MREKILIKPPQIAWQPGPVFKFPYNMVYNCYEPTKRCFIICPLSKIQTFFE